jgi:6-phosphogluconate dehydrogenase (decarboxylating)
LRSELQSEHAREVSQLKELLENARRDTKVIWLMIPIWHENLH